MDEHREEREELAQLARDDADDARNQESERRYWLYAEGLSWAEFVSVESELWARP